MNIEERSKALETFAAAYDAVHTAIAEIPAAAMHYRPAAGRWTIHEILIHLADSEVNAYQRCRTCIAEPGGRIVAYDQDRWANALRYTEQDSEDALELFRLLRKMTNRVLRGLPDSTWSLTFEHSERGTLTLDDWLETYAAHIPGHINQIQDNFSAWQASQRG